MFSFMPFGFLFIFVLAFGSILSLSSLHWLSIWAGLEINLMGFIPILVYRGISQETESGMKYFIIQALGSGMIMMGSLLAFNLSFTWENAPSPKIYLGMVILLFGLMLKLGSFPFHFWLPSVMAGISWLGCLLLTTWQKLAPLFLLAMVVKSWSSMNNFVVPFLLLAASLSSLIGGIGGLNQTQIRALLAYSSIGHIGWMLLCSILSVTILKIYFVIYFIVSVSTFVILWNSEKSLFSQTSNTIPENTKLNEISLIFMLLSLGGMPPLLGFFGKWLAIWGSCMSQSYLLLLPFLAGSLVSLFYYLSLMFSVSLFSSTKLNTTATQQSDLTLMFDFPKNQNLIHLTNFIFIFNLMGGILISLALPTFDFM
uniref:NADH-ubiquinone oxidoreductase chain 2 n=1 Tax=Clanculus margaritarius TaxID=648588 RepID=A0A2P0VPK0_9VEST|nr:NADH dehydrogenase subunit 2 [Clanculus margaritarius]